MANRADSVVTLGSFAIFASDTGIVRGPIPQHLAAMKNKLVRLGGERVVVTMDYLQERIRDRGYPLAGNVPPINGAEPNSCHRTAGILQLLAPADRQIMTGYALSDDGCWRRHSWVLQSGKILEPTAERVLYFGFPIVDPLEVLRFVWPEIRQDLYLHVYERVRAGELGGKRLKLKDLRYVQQLLDGGARDTPAATPPAVPRQVGKLEPST